ncbi:hypothetical protein ACIA5D_17160 [Actinoplanes sp. NPDC051513]|uniref:hypothetical protein n=1 Tax=Actinoplanes sp. NPDC051513 TaxID=3363908 RepID=UPI0037BB0CB2
MKRWGLFLFAAGIGVIVGVQAGEPAMLPALVAVVAGLLLFVVRARSGERDLVGDAAAARAGGGAAPLPKASLQGLGSQVEHILKIAEEQAADHIAEAKATAAQIVAQAQAQADAERMKSP